MKPVEFACTFKRQYTDEDGEILVTLRVPFKNLAEAIAVVRFVKKRIRVKMWLEPNQNEVLGSRRAAPKTARPPR